MVKEDNGISYICANRGNENQYWVLLTKGGINAGRITTFLLDNVLRGTDWRVVVVNSLNYIDGQIKWVFSKKEDFYAFLGCK